MFAFLSSQAAFAGLSVLELAAESWELKSQKSTSLTRSCQVWGVLLQRERGEFSRAEAVSSGSQDPKGRSHLAWQDLS